MSAPPERESRPAGRGAALETQPGGLIPMVDARDEIARHLDGTFVLVVRTNGRLRRRCYLSVKAAEAAASKALARGENATVVLAQLKPLYRVTP